jgi:hypothetical protein
MLLNRNGFRLRRALADNFIITKAFVGPSKSSQLRSHFGSLCEPCEEEVHICERKDASSHVKVPEGVLLLLRSEVNHEGVGSTSE